MISKRTGPRRRKNLFPNLPTQAERREMRLKNLDAIRNRWWKENKRMCGICFKPIVDRAEYTLDHITPGTYKSDDESNLQPAHYDCNMAKGSKRNFTL